MGHKQHRKAENPMTPAGANRRKGQPVPAPGQNSKTTTEEGWRGKSHQQQATRGSTRPTPLEARQPSLSGQLDIEVSPKAGFINEHWIITAM